MTKRHVAVFALLFGFWIMLSWRFTPMFLIIGAASAAAVTAVAVPLMASAMGPAMDLTRVPIRVARFVGYVLWLLGRIAVAGAQIAFTVITPGRPGEPQLLQFETRLATPAARTMLANSISVVPGTITLENDDGEFLVHAFRKSDADDLVTATLQNRIAALYDLQPEDPPQVAWNPHLDPAAEGGTTPSAGGDA